MRNRWPGGADFIDTFDTQLPWVATGRACTNIGEGIIQLGLQAGVKLNLAPQSTLDDYTNKINLDREFYYTTPIGRSLGGKITEFGTEMLIYSILPVGAGARGAKLLYSSAAAGAVIGGIQPVADGSFSGRLNNAAVGTGVGAAGASIVPLFKVAKPAITTVANKVIGKTNSLLSQFKNYNLSQNNSFNQVVINGSRPAEIYYGYGNLNNRQTQILQQLPKPNMLIKLHKSDINVRDLAALTAQTGNGFALFTLSSRRILIRGDNKETFINKDLLNQLKLQGWRWSAHTHPGTKDLVLDASGLSGDRGMLQLLKQDRSLILNSAGRRNVFDINNNLHITPNTESVVVVESSKNLIF